MCADNSSKPNAIAAFVAEKCPRCRKGKMFRYPMYRIDKLVDMHTHCQACGLKFERETGFYYGAMYVSYAFMVATLVIEFVAMNSFLEIHDPNIWYAVIMGSLLLLLPIFLRYSRGLYLRLAGRISYDALAEQTYHNLNHQSMGSASGTAPLTSA